MLSRHLVDEIALFSKRCLLILSHLFSLLNWTVPIWLNYLIEDQNTFVKCQVFHESSFGFQRSCRISFLFQNMFTEFLYSFHKNHVRLIGNRGNLKLLIIQSLYYKIRKSCYFTYIQLVATFLTHVARIPYNVHTYVHATSIGTRQQAPLISISRIGLLLLFMYYVLIYPFTTIVILVANGFCVQHISDMRQMYSYHMCASFKGECTV